ncbi:MAG: type VI secretion system protein TssA [Alphaproteobacteria bacterium]
MASSETLDFKVLLAAIPGEKPGGESAAYDLRSAIEDARRADDQLAKGAWGTEKVKTADWVAVTKFATEALATKSKDLRVAVRLSEALVKRHGFAGFRDGCRLLRELQENFWDSLYPEIDEGGDLEARSADLQWLNDKLTISIRDVPLTEGDVRYSWYRWDESQKVDNAIRQNPAAKAAAEKEGKIDGATFAKAVAATSRAYYEALFEDLKQGFEECEKLIRAADEKFGKQAPSLLDLRTAVEDCRSLVEDLVKAKRKLDPAYKPEEEAVVVADSSKVPEAEPQATAVNNPIARNGVPREPTSREDAYQRLAIIADYLKKTEPQNPVSYLVERAVRWAQMPLEQWLGEVIQNQDVLKHLRETLGIKN